MTLAELLTGAAVELDGVVAVSAGPGTEFRVGDVLVALITPDGAAEFRLDPAVAAAARRTPATSASNRGPDWVRFAPITLEPHATDRAVAWLGSAARRAGGG
jgi:hypothetical protein